MIFMKRILKEITIQSIFLYCTLFACLLNSLNISLLYLPLNPFVYLSLIFGILLIIDKILKKQIKFKLDSYILFTLFLIMILTTVFSIYNFNENKAIIIMTNFIMIICLYIFNDSSGSQNLNFYKIIVIFSTVTAIISLISILLNCDFAFIGEKLTGLYSNPNLGSQITLISMLIIIFYLKNNYKNKLIYFILLVIHFIFLYFNMSKNTYLIIIILLFLSLLRQQSKKIWIIIISMLMILATFVIFNRNIIFSDSLNISKYTDTEIIINDLSTERYAIWKESIYLIENNIVFGHGVGSLQNAASAEIGDESRIVVRRITATHNLFLQVFFDSGFFAILLMLIFIYFIFKSVIKTYKYNGLFSKQGFASTLILSSFLFSQLDIGIINYLLITSFIFWTHSKTVIHQGEIF